MKFETFGVRLRMLRKEKGWRQVDLSERTHIDLSTLSKYEQGSSHPTYWNLMEIAKILDVSLDELCGMDSVVA